jgi:hypothetical protein
MLRLLIFIVLSLILSAVTGCQKSAVWLEAELFQADTTAGTRSSAEQFVRSGTNDKPRIRVGNIPVPKYSTDFLGLNDLGQHGYTPNLSERNGLVYTCKAGHIDISHARKAADWTVFLAAKTYKQLMNNNTDFTFKMYEPSLYFVKLKYPDNWKDLSKDRKEKIAYDVAVTLGQYLTFTAMTWHEIITWFGYKGRGFISEQASAFSWEDSFSNLFGVHIASLALEDKEHTYDDAVTLAFDRELQKLEIQSSGVSLSAARSVEGSWYRKNLVNVTMIKRNFDIGLGDGFVTAILVPSVPEFKGVQPQSLPIPDIDILSDYGFSFQVEILPKIWEGHTILNVAFPDRQLQKGRINPVLHFPMIMDYIKEDANKRYGTQADVSAGIE